MEIYDFDRQLMLGTSGEEFLDHCLSLYYDIKKASSEEEKKGIDRFFKCKKTEKIFSVEYKTDMKGHRTGKAFIETISVDSYRKAGWAITCQADFLIYFVVELKKAFVIKPEKIKSNLDLWAEKFSERSAKNSDGYNTFGLLVPLIELQTISEKILIFKGEKIFEQSS